MPGRSANLACLLAAALLAGCAQSGEPAQEPPQTFTTTATPAPVAKLTTDTFHLLARPDMTTRAPTAQEPIRVPIDSFFNQTVAHGPTGAFRDTWDTTLPAPVHGFVGNATLVVEVTGTLVADPRTALFGPGCFWTLSVVAGSFETGDSQGLGCVKAASTVGPGLYTLAFPFSLTEVSWDAGTVLHFQLHTYEQGARAPGAKAELLTGSVAHDSTIRVLGLRLPVDPSLLLQATG